MIFFLPSIHPISFSATLGKKFDLRPQKKFFDGNYILRILTVIPKGYLLLRDLIKL